MLMTYQSLGPVGVCTCTSASSALPTNARASGESMLISLLQVELIGADDAVASLLAVFVLKRDPGTEVHPARIARALADHFQLLQALGQKAHTAVDLAQHFLAVGVLGVFGAIALRCRLADRLGDLRTPDMPKLVQLCTQACLASGVIRGVPAARGGR